MKIVSQRDGKKVDINEFSFDTEHYKKLGERDYRNSIINKYFNNRTKFNNSQLVSEFSHEIVDTMIKVCDNKYVD